MKKTTIIAALAVALGLASLNASAADNVTTNPSLIITTTCTVGLSGDTGFTGQVYSGSVGSAPLVSATATLTVACPGTSYWLGASAGNNSVAGVRYLQGGQTVAGVSYTLALGGAGGTKANLGNDGATPAFTGTILTGADAFHQTSVADSHTYTVIATTEAVPAGTKRGTYNDVVLITAAF
jgi:hypothetical protein